MYHLKLQMSCFVCYNSVTFVQQLNNKGHGSRKIKTK